MTDKRRVMAYSVDREIADAARLAMSLMRWAVEDYRDGLHERAADYRRRAWFWFDHARGLRDRQIARLAAAQLEDAA